MTFRIDSAHREANGTWRWMIKGIRGEGIYGSLLTGPDGQALYLASFERGRPDLEVLDTTFSAKTTLVGDANSALSLALTALGWGPEVDTYRNLVRR